jgi:hypothetical protein
MTDRKQYHFFVFFMVLQIVWLQTGCKKEYSYEGGTILPVVHDTISPPSGINKFPQCSLCKSTDDLLVGKWNFKTGNSFVCGTVDGSGFIGNSIDKRVFTFFGPSACSIDTGLVMTIYLPISLDHDMYNVYVSQPAFYYYDHNAPKDIFISLSLAEFSATIKSYISATGIATGTFSGTVFKPNGDTTFVSDGNYKIKLK